MPGLIWSSKGEVLSGGAGVPDGTAGGQLLVWNAAAGEWQPQLVTPGDIGAAAAAHTHQWGDIASVGTLYTEFAADGREFVPAGTTEDLNTIATYAAAVLFLVEYQNSSNHYSSVWLLIKSAGTILVNQVAGSAAGSVSIVPASTYIVRYTAPASIILHWLFLPFGVR